MAHRWHVNPWQVHVTVRCVWEGPESWHALLVQIFLPDSKPGQWAWVDLGILVTQAADAVILLRKAIAKATAAWWKHRTFPFARLEHMRFKTARVMLTSGNERVYSQVHLMELEPAAIERFVYEGRLMDTEFCFYTNRDLRMLVAVGRKDRARHEAAQERAAHIEA